MRFDFIKLIENVKYIAIKPTMSSHQNDHEAKWLCRNRPLIFLIEYKQQNYFQLNYVHIFSNILL